ncbi:MAG: DUF1501 domain-containing protein [Verrucomicrobium sp.]|nr:DUF1501 domain-containing protein [Verrucomicrobium sp.]
MHLTRRYFLKTSGLLALYCGITPFDLLAQAGLSQKDIRPVAADRTLVVVFLRGGMDGLNFVVPHGDADYYKLRQSIAIAAPGSADGALDLDGHFGLHPRAAALRPLFQSGRAVALQAVGYDKNTRSHFEEQDTWETGVIGNTIASDGWLNRHLLTSAGRGPIRAVSVGDTLPRILRGEAPAYSMRGVDDLAFPKTAAPQDQALVGAALEHAYCCGPREAGQYAGAARDLLAETAQATFSGIEQLRGVVSAPYQPGAAYPENEFGRKLREVARLIKAGVGLEVAEIDYGGWDTHQNQGGAAGNYGNMVEGLAQGLAAFNQDLGSRMENVLVLTLSDFGRTAKENGTKGTDHGWANCMLAVGGPVKNRPRPVLGNWPGLGPEQLHERRDLLHTTDFRDVLGEVVRVHLGNPNIERILPGHAFQPVGLV